jgi:Zn-finger nucleic acid-binding protein
MSIRARKAVKKKVHRNSKIVPEGERKCPICDEFMHVEKIKHVSVDICQEHGIWMDKGEFTKISRRIKANLDIQRDAAVRQAKHDGKVSGTLLGMWAFLFD